MKKKHLVWHLFPAFWVITFIFLIAITIYFIDILEKFYIEQNELHLQEKAYLIRNQIDEAVFDLNNVSGDSLCNKLSEGVDSRITLIDSQGRVAGDSREESALMENHTNRPEIASALKGQSGLAIRYSQTVKFDMMYAAVPVLRDNKIVGVIRVSMPLGEIHNVLQSIYLNIALGGLAIVILIVVAGIITGKRISRPLENMRQIAAQYAHGDFSRRTPDHGALEIGGLAEAMNQMAFQLDNKIHDISRQRNEQQAVLSSMIEGVLAVDLNEKIINLNQSAKKMLAIEDNSVIGRYVVEVIRNTKLQEFIRKAIEKKQPIEEEITPSGLEKRYWQAHGAALRDAAGSLIGAVIVLNDITRLRLLENVRRDFVANVSHELKTPITSIKGFVETLKDGAMNNPEIADRFLGIIVNQTNRLNAIIEDLLNLSRLELQEEKNEIDLQEYSVKDPLVQAIQTCEPKSQSAEIKISLECNDELTAMMNPDLLVQAVVNLIDNAIKYSPKGGAVLVEALPVNDEIRINVIDQGIGIAREHLPRIFERFYRIEKERGGESGGTGLGLAIVKHIALAHHGRVEVDSVLGKGSKFSLYIPRFTKAN